jgi:hypothetical protein
VTRAFWTSAFLDLALDDLAVGTGFWAAVTGYDGTAVADLSREFPPLRPSDGAPYLWVQRVSDPPSRVHVDLHVHDVDASLDQAKGLGAELVERRDHAVLRSPSGFVFCLVTDAGGSVPRPRTWPSGQVSRVDRLRMEVPARYLGEEVPLWEALRPTAPHALEIEIARGLETVPRAVLEVGTSERRTEVARHSALGARLVAEHAVGTDLVDPVGIRYRVVDRTD